MIKSFAIFAAAAVALPVAAFAGASSGAIGVAKAVSIAEARTGARALDAETDRLRDGRMVYSVELAKGNDLRELVIDAKSGNVLTDSKSRIMGMWSAWTDREERRHLTAARPMAVVLSELEARSGGTVTEASFDVEAGQPRYEVEVATDAGVTQVYLDPKTGDRLSLVMDD